MSENAARKEGIDVPEGMRVCLFTARSSPVFCITEKCSHLVRWLKAEEEEKLVKYLKEAEGE